MRGEQGKAHQEEELHRSHVSLHGHLDSTVFFGRITPVVKDI
jgi:hypothetical protein